MDRCSLAPGQHGVLGRLHASTAVCVYGLCVCVVFFFCFRQSHRRTEVYWFSALAIERSQILALNPFDMLLPMNTTLNTWCDTRAKDSSTSSSLGITRHVLQKHIVFSVCNCMCDWVRTFGYFFCPGNDKWLFKIWDLVLGFNLSWVRVRHVVVMVKLQGMQYDLTGIEVAS